MVCAQCFSNFFRNAIAAHEVVDGKILVMAACFHAPGQKQLRGKYVSFTLISAGREIAFGGQVVHIDFVVQQRMAKLMGADVSQVRIVSFRAYDDNLYSAALDVISLQAFYRRIYQLDAA